MKTRRNILFFAFCCLFTVQGQASRWTTHFAYNNVTQIAMSEDKVYALSDGSLYSVDKCTEQLKVYNRQSGLHGTGITCIHYDAVGKQLLIGYGTGKIDILSDRSTRYISELYDKDMTQRKTINNITIEGRTAYFSTPYGVQTFDLREGKLVDSYWLRPGGKETEVRDVLLRGDSIYAFTSDSLFSAKRTDNLPDYTVWKRAVRDNRVSPDGEKGKHYQDATDHWYAGYTEGIIRFTPTSRLTYKPNGPFSNKPYYLLSEGNQLFMLAGGRWTTQNQERGDVMIYRNKQWIAITADSIRLQSGAVKVIDMMNVAIDPRDDRHFYVTSYGTGLYEFRNDRCVGHEIANGVIGSAASDIVYYTRLIGAHFDKEGRLWFLDAGAVNNQVIIKEGDVFYGLPLLIDGQQMPIHIPSDLMIDQRNERHKWIICAYKTAGVVLLDDGGTPIDGSDDKSVYRNEWVDQNGRRFKPDNILASMQDRQNRIWIATEQGVAYIDGETDFFSSNAIIQPQVTDDSGENPMTSLRIKALCQTPDGLIWVGTESVGVYVLNEAADEIVAHYTTENSAMSSNGILSLCSDEQGHVWVGTAEGLVEYDPQGIDEGLKAGENGSERTLDEGSMQQWKLHFSYTNPTALAATPNRIYAAASGSLFSVDRQDGEIEYWNKSTGLRGNGVAHIAYDGGSGKLIIAYENGQIDLLSNNGDVSTMPDISMKAGSIDVQINSICVGKQKSYIAMPFGIIAINPKKNEVTDTYYIGEQASSIAVQQVVETKDSLFAFCYDRMYKSALDGNPVDYTFWSYERLGCEQVQQAMAWKDEVYIVHDSTLYRRQNGSWKPIAIGKIQWISAYNGQMLVYKDGGLYRLNEEEELEGLSKNYRLNAAIYTNGEYWVAQTNNGLIRLGTNGDEHYHTEGPNSNFGYCMYAAHGQIYSAVGGRWASPFVRPGRINIYDGQGWRSINEGQIGPVISAAAYDLSSIAVDPQDAGHFFAAAYGRGVFEFRDYKAYKQYSTHNSLLREAVEGINASLYTYTDGAMMDEQKNLWVLNATSAGSPVHVLTAQGQWDTIPLITNGQRHTLTTPTGIWVDRRNSQWKWLMDQRSTPYLYLLDDGGTPAYHWDDRCAAHNTFVDQNGHVLSPAQFRSFAQDHTNRLWIGTEAGIIIIPAEVDFFRSNACKRIIIPRNDGTNLGDYLLGNEQINCLAVDGSNRIWIGTAGSGLYLIEDDTITVAHFTAENSLLPSNTIQSIAILPTTGEVFVGTDNGIASYRSDASEPSVEMSDAYAYPNPVRPEYSGMISICGLMDNSEVRIVDASGGLVCKTRSHGGTAVWDGKLPDGRIATAGVYTALCNTEGGHAVVKILVIR